MGLVSDVSGKILTEMRKAVVGQDAAMQDLLVGLLAEGHILLEGVPGVAKTLMVKALAESISAAFQRVQFTPDLMPSDILGTNVFDMATSQFRLKKGPIFADLLLADEINRTPPKTQSALLEAMEERQVTIDGVSLPLPPVFTVFATQNPVEYEGTYPLPEAQLDRFMLKVVVNYPGEEEERGILRRYHAGFAARDFKQTGIGPAADPQTIQACRREIQGVTVEDSVVAYIAAVVRTSRSMPQLVLGASPRAGVMLLQGAKTWAALSGREFAVPDDVKRMAHPVLRHRLILRPEAQIEGLTADDVITSLLESIQVPR